MGIFDLFKKKKEEKKQSPYLSPSPEDKAEKNETIQKMPPKDETFLEGESMSIVKPDGSNMGPGDVVRTWSRINGWWAGWWGEVQRLEGDKAIVKNLKTGEVSTKFMLGLSKMGGLWKHPNPEHVRAYVNKLSENMIQLKNRYEAMDFTRSSEQEMINVLRDELGWQRANMRDYYDMKEEFNVHRILIRKVGEELNRRGSIELMRKIFLQVPGDRNLESEWNGIGEWLG